jgi:hypothetical protein
VSSRFSVTTSAGGFATVVLAPQLMFIDKIYGGTLNTLPSYGYGAGNMGTCFTGAPVGIDNAITDGFATPLFEGQGHPADGTNGSGYARYVGSEISVQYLGTANDCGGQYYVVDGSTESALVYGRVNCLGVSFKAATTDPIATVQAIGPRKTTFRFLNNSVIYPGFWDVPRDATWSGTADDIIPEAMFEHACLGFTNGLFISAAVPGTKFQVTVNAWYEDSYHPLPNYPNPLIPSTVLSVGNPTAHAAASAHTAAVAHATRNGMSRGWLEAAEGMVSRTARTWGPRLINAAEAYGSRLISEAIGGFPPL